MICNATNELMDASVLSHLGTTFSALDGGHISTNGPTEVLVTKGKQVSTRTQHKHTHRPSSPDSLEQTRSTRQGANTCDNRS